MCGKSGNGMESENHDGASCNGMEYYHGQDHEGCPSRMQPRPLGR